MRWKLFIPILLTVAGAYAESWTNAAGHSVEAVLVARKGNVLTMKRENGSTFTIHVKALSKAGQALADKKIPPKDKLSHEEVVAQRNKKRMQQLRQRKQDAGK